MIDTAWKWAERNNKLIRETVHGAEMISVNVERLRRSVDEQGARMTHSAQTQLEDTTASILDAVPGTVGVSGTSDGGGNPEETPAPPMLGCTFGGRI